MDPNKTYNPLEDINNPDNPNSYIYQERERIKKERTKAQRLRKEAEKRNKEKLKKRIEEERKRMQAKEEEQPAYRKAKAKSLHLHSRWFIVSLTYVRSTH